MDMLLLLVASVMWSFVGTFVKTATSMFNSSFISNISMMLNFLWSWIFFKEHITSYILIGGAIFITGVILLNSPTREKPVKK